MTLSEVYHARVLRGEIEEDPLQQKALVSLQHLTESLKEKKKFWNPFKKTQPPQGIYIYGPVGAGKTFLMDLFYADSGSGPKLRFHFHHFMQQIDARLRQLQGQKNPIQHIAREIALLARVLCFDEFMVHDVAHAMILAELMKCLFEAGVVLVATSNTHPDALYKEGPQRQRFLPAIAAIKENCLLIRLGNMRDYRLNRGEVLPSWFFPLNSLAEKQLADKFAETAPQALYQQKLGVQSREIMCRAYSRDAVWFDFNVICSLPRSQLDYLEIASRFNTVFLSGLPELGEKDTVAAILLIHFIDVLYDKGIRLIVSADTSIENVYLQGEMALEFRRTSSRLQEMQSWDYLRRHPHYEEKNLS